MKHRDALVTVGHALRACLFDFPVRKRGRGAAAPALVILRARSARRIPVGVLPGNDPLPHPSPRLRWGSRAARHGCSGSPAGPRRSWSSGWSSCDGQVSPARRSRHGWACRDRPWLAGSSAPVLAERVRWRRRNQFADASASAQVIFCISTPRSFVESVRWATASGATDAPASVALAGSSSTSPSIMRPAWPMSRYCKITTARRRPPSSSTPSASSPPAGSAINVAH